MKKSLTLVLFSYFIVISTNLFASGFDDQNTNLSEECYEEYLNNDEKSYAISKRDSKKQRKRKGDKSTLQFKIKRIENEISHFKEEARLLKALKVEIKKQIKEDKIFLEALWFIEAAELSVTSHENSLRSKRFYTESLSKRVNNLSYNDFESSQATNTESCYVRNLAPVAVFIFVVARTIMFTWDSISFEDYDSFDPYVGS